MLPDYIQLKNEIDEVLTLFMRRRVNFHSCGFKDVPSERLFEGGGMGVKRPSGEFDQSNFIESSTEFSIEYEEVPNLSLDNILEKIDNVAKDMANNIEKHLYKKMSEDLDRLGRTVDKKGKKLSAETILEALQSIQIEFDESGRHHNLQMHIPPQLEDATKKAFADLEEDPVLRKRHEDLMIQKREEWRAREAARKLVG